MGEQPPNYIVQLRYCSGNKVKSAHAGDNKYCAVAAEGTPCMNPGNVIFIGLCSVSCLNLQ